ncbi:MAG: sugar phosphate isomerase/epimerase family protein [Phycisphaeraceae bacterium]
MTWTLSAFADEADIQIGEQIRALQEAGYRHVDLRGVNDYNITELPEDEAQKVRQQLDDAGIRVFMFGSPIGKIDITDDFEIDHNKLKHLGKLKDILGCERVRIFSYFNKTALPEAEWRRAALDRLKQLAETAGTLGLELFHENESHIFGDVCDRVEVLADELRGARFRLIFDFDNYNRCGDDVWKNWTRLRDRTDAFHLKDSNAEGMHVPVGEGNGKVREILADAFKRGWEGPLTLEPHLKRSEAVVATGPEGQSNEALKDMGPFGAFQVGAAAAKRVLEEVGAQYE